MTMLRLAAVNLVPFVVPLAVGKVAVQHRDAFLPGGKPALEPLHRLRRQRDFGHEHQRRLPTLECAGDSLEVNLRLAAAGHAEQYSTGFLSAAGASSAICTTARAAACSGMSVSCAFGTKVSCA